MARNRNRFTLVALVACGLAGATCSSALADDVGAPAPSVGNEDRRLRAADPIRLDIDRNLFARTLRPVASNPAHAPTPRRKGGLGEIPASPEELIWRVGPQVVRPIRPDDPLSAGDWRAGLASVAFAVEGVRMYGALPSDRCALAGELDSGSANGFLIQPFVNYNLPDGWYLASVPVIRADWTAPSGQKWTVPMGASIGKLGRLGEMPLTMQAGYYYNVERPDGASDWALRLQVRLTFPP
jgi:hypothetical protein